MTSNGELRNSPVRRWFKELQGFKLRNRDSITFWLLLLDISFSILGSNRSFCNPIRACYRWLLNNQVFLLSASPAQATNFGWNSSHAAGPHYFAQTDMPCVLISTGSALIPSFVCPIFFTSSYPPCNPHVPPADGTRVTADCSPYMIGKRLLLHMISTHLCPTYPGFPSSKLLT